MKKVILNQISKAVTGGNNYFYLPLFLKGEGNEAYYETSVDLSKLFEVDSNGVPVIKEICVYDEDSSQNVYLSYSGGSKGDYNYINHSDDNQKLSHNGINLLYNDIAVRFVEQKTNETNGTGSPKDGEK